jgi:putative flippase GtrA
MRGAHDAIRRHGVRLGRYGATGLALNGFGYVLFLGLLQLGVPPLAGAAVCYVLGLMGSYVINRRWTFESGESHFHDLPKFILAYGIGLVSTLATLSILIQWLRPEFAQIINTFTTALVIYICLQKFRFGGLSSQCRSDDNLHNELIVLPNLIDKAMHHSQRQPQREGEVLRQSGEPGDRA